MRQAVFWASTRFAHCHAIALVTFQANGLMAVFQEPRHISKPFSNGQYAFAGVSAALMSAAGLEGVDDIIGAREGLLDAWGVEDGRALVTRGLGEDFAIMGANFKFVSACYPIHAAVEAAMALVAEHEIDADAIASVHVGLPASSVPVVDNRPVHNTCMQDMLSAVLVRGGLSLRDSPFPAILDDAGFARLRSRIAVGVDPGLEREFPNGRGASVAITTQSGSTVFAARRLAAGPQPPGRRDMDRPVGEMARRPSGSGRRPDARACQAPRRPRRGERFVRGVYLRLLLHGYRLTGP